MAPGMGQSDDSCSWLARSGLGVSKASPLLVSVCARPLCSFLLFTGEVEVFLPYAHSSFMDEGAARTAAKPNGSGTPTASTAKRGGRTGLCVGARSATALPHVAAFAKTLAVPVTVQFAQKPRRLYGRIEECQEYLSGYGIDVHVADQIGARHVEAAAEQAEEGLLVFDRAFSRGMRKRAGRRLVGRLIKDSQNTILLCP